MGLGQFSMAVIVLTCLLSSTSYSRQAVIYETDSIFDTDDHNVMIYLLDKHAKGVIDLKGIIVNATNGRNFAVAGAAMNIAYFLLDQEVEIGAYMGSLGNGRFPRVAQNQWNQNNGGWTTFAYEEVIYLLFFPIFGTSAFNLLFPNQRRPYPNGIPITRNHSQVWDSTVLYDHVLRNLGSGQDLKVISTGLQTSLAELMLAAQSNSWLRDQIRNKIEGFYVMGGNTGTQGCTTTNDFNFRGLGIGELTNIPGMGGRGHTQFVFEEISKLTNVIFSGQGTKPESNTYINAAITNPARWLNITRGRRNWNQWTNLTAFPTPHWDMVAARYAVEGDPEGYLRHETTGSMVINSNATSCWEYNNNPLLNTTQENNMSKIEFIGGNRRAYEANVLPRVLAVDPVYIKQAGL